MYLNVDELDNHRRDEIRRYNRHVLNLIKFKYPNTNVDKKFVDVLCAGYPLFNYDANF